VPVPGDEARAAERLDPRATLGNTLGDGLFLAVSDRREALRCALGMIDAAARPGVFCTTARTDAASTRCAAAPSSVAALGH